MVYNLAPGGTETQCLRVATGFRDRGDFHRVAVSRREGRRLADVETRCGPVFATGIRRFRTPGWPGRVWRLARWMKSNRFDLVHTWDSDSALFGGWAARVAGIPFLTSRRETGEIHREWKRALMARADRRAAGVIVNARALSDDVACRGVSPDRIHHVPNLLVSPGPGDEASPPWPADLPDGLRFLLVCRLAPEKDVDTALRALRVMLDAGENAVLVVAGEGPERHRLEKTLAELDLMGRVRLMGFVFPVSALVAAADVGLLTPCANEGSSNAILEYLTGGLPVVATDCGGNRELVRPGENGLLAAPGDARAVGLAMLGLARDGALRKTMAAASAARVRQWESRDTILNSLAVLYRQCTGQDRDAG